MKKILYFCLALALLTKSYAQQVTITPDGINPKNTHPRISYEAILALPDPQEGDLAFDTTNKCLRIFINGSWICSFQDPNTYTPPMNPIISAGGLLPEFANDIVVDNSGNIYLTGAYMGTTKFGAVEKTSAGATDIFVAKFNSSGVLQWLKSAGGTSTDVGQSIAVDTNGNVYITGSYSGDATFETITLTSPEHQQTFVAKYNSSGVFQWVNGAGSEQNNSGTGIALDTVGDIFITGSYSDYASFGTTTLTAQGELNEPDIFIAKINSSGVFQWAQSAGGQNKDFGRAIAVDNTGIYITGSFESTATFGTIDKTATGLSDLFLAKYNTSGVAQWVKSAGGSADDYGTSLALDGSGNVYVTGFYYGTATFDATTIGTGIANTYEILLAKYNSSGVLQWAQSAGGTGFDNGNGVAVHGSNVYLTGYFSGTATFGTYSVVSKGETDIFVAKYNSSGVCYKVQSAGSTSQDIGTSVATDTSGKGYVTGQYSGTVIFGSTSKSSQGFTDIFVIKVE